MRNLTIVNEKTLLGRFSADTVYIEDRESDCLIGGVPCRKLGTVKSGEESTFLIGEGEARIFVLSGKLVSKRLCDFCRIPAGQEDVTLRGKRVLTAGDGGFRFDVSADEELVAVRKARMLKGLAVRIVSFVLAFVVGYIVFETAFDNSKSFSSKEITIALTEDFEQAFRADPFELYLASRDMVVSAERISIALNPELALIDLHGFASLIKEQNTFGDSEIEWKEEDGLLYAEASISAVGTEYQSYVFLYKYQKTFWVVQFHAHFSIADESRAQIFEWAKDISFKPQV